MTITYAQVGDYLLPNLIPPESPKVGRWGMLRFNYLRKHREALYTIMLMEGHKLMTSDAIRDILVSALQLLLNCFRHTL